MAGVESNQSAFASGRSATVGVAVSDPGVRTALRSAIDETDGLRSDTLPTGDGAVVEFGEAGPAVRCLITDRPDPLAARAREAGFGGPVLLVADPTDGSVSEFLDDAVTDVLPPTLPEWPSTVIANRLRQYLDTFRAVHDREQTLTALHRATRELMSAETETEIARGAADAASRVLGFPGTGVRLYDPEQDALVNVSFDGDAAEAIDARPPLPIEGTPHGEAFSTGRTVIHDVPDGGGPYELDPFEQTMYVPLGEHGVLSVGRRDATGFDASDVKYAEILAANVTAALDRADRERLLRTRERRLQRERDRLEEFANAIAHDLRNPLNVAQGYLDQLEGSETALERIETAHGRMQRLISDVLTLARSGDVLGERTPVDLERVVRNSWGTVATRQAELTVERPLGSVEADRERLRAVCENLFQNAVDHAGPEARVRVGRLEDADGWYVADDGPGIPVDARERVLEQGYSDNPAGTGFGLTIVKRVVNAHGWSLRLAESWAGGARIEVRTT